MSIINVVLKAVDEYSQTLTGLNQGLELVSKGFGFVKDAGEIAWSAVNKGLELAADGGTYNEIRRQFNNVADSFGRDGSAILKTLDDITNSTLSMPAAAGIAGKGIAAGLSEGQIESAFTFIKRRTELTGESFESMADTVFRALQSGRTSVLGSMGIAVEKGDDLETVMRKITDATKSYGDAGYNLADDLDLMGQAQERFALAIGSSIAETGFIQDAIQALAGAVSDFIDWFDPRPLTVFFDIFGQMVIDAVSGFAKVIPGLSDVFDYIKNLTSVTGDNFGVFVLGVSESLFSIVRTVATVTNEILNILDQMGIITFVEFVVSTVVETLRVGGGFITEAIGAIISTTIEGFSEIISLIAEWARANPTLADSFGLDPMALTDMEMGFKKAARGVGDMTEAFQKGIEKAADFGQSINAELSQALKTQRFDVTAIDQYENEMKSRISKIDFSKSWGEALSTGQKAQTELNQQTAYTAKMSADLAKDTEKSMKEAEKAQKELAKEQQRAEKEKLDLEKESIKERQRLFKEQMDAEKEALKERQAIAKEQMDAEKEKLKLEYEKIKEDLAARKEAIKEAQELTRERFEAEKEALKERQEKYKEQFDSEKDALKDRQEKFREQMDAEKDALKDRQEKFREQMDAEKEALKERQEKERENYDLTKQNLVNDKEKKDELISKQQDAIRANADADKELRDKLEKIAREKAETDVAAIAEQLKGLQIKLDATSGDTSLTPEARKAQETAIKAEIDLLRQAEKDRQEALKKELESIKENSKAEQDKSKKQLDGLKKQAEKEAKTYKEKLKKLDEEKKAADKALKEEEKRLAEKQKKEEAAQKAIAKEIEAKQKKEEDAQKAIAKDIEARQKKEAAAQKEILDTMEAQRKEVERAAQADLKNIADIEKEATKAHNADMKNLESRQDKAKKIHDDEMKRLDEKAKKESKDSDALLRGLDQAIKNIGKGGAVATTKEAAKELAKDIAKETAKETAKEAAKAGDDPSKAGSVWFEDQLLAYQKTIKDAVIDIRDSDKTEGSGLSETDIMMALARWLKRQLASDAMGEGIPIVAVG